MRSPSDKELSATAVLEFSIEEASAKIRQGPPVDDEDDYNLPVWAAVLPLNWEAKTPISQFTAWRNTGLKVCMRDASEVESESS